MATGCFKCGAYPNHPNPALDTLKLLQCSDCGNISCISHRKGILGGACSKCGSSRSFIIAIRKGGKKGNDQQASAVSAGGGSASSGGGSINNANVAISSSTLKDMQKVRADAERDARKRQDDLANKALQKNMSTQEREQAQKAEEKVQSLLGSKSLIMAATAVEKIKSAKRAKDTQDTNNAKLDIPKPEEDISEKFTNLLNTESFNNKSSSKDINSSSSISSTSSNMAIAVENKKVSPSTTPATDKNEKTDAEKESKAKKVKESEFKSFTSGLAVSTFESFDSKLKVKKVKSKKQPLDKKDSDDSSNEKISTFYKHKAGNKTVNIVDSFCVKANEKLDLYAGIERKKLAEKEIAIFFANELNIADQVKCNLEVNCLIPVDNIDHLLNFEPSVLKKEKISLITGFLGKSFNYENEAFLEQLELILPNKQYISGIYTCFSDDNNFSIEEQKEINLRLIDMAQESGKTVYIGLENLNIDNWKEIFDEYDLSEINFIYTETINNDDELNFITENNIKILIRPDINYEYYSEILNSNNKVCLGSGFEKLQEKSEDDNTGNSVILTKIIKNMHNIDKNLLELLLNCQ